MLIKRHVRTRAALFATLAAGMLAGGIAPIASALPNGGGGPRKLSKSECKALQTQANQDSDAAAAAFAAGNKVDGFALEAIADIEYDTAHRGGCAWAARVRDRSIAIGRGQLATFGGH